MEQTNPQHPYFQKQYFENISEIYTKLKSQLENIIDKQGGGTSKEDNSLAEMAESMLDFNIGPEERGDNNDGLDDQPKFRVRRQ